MMRLLFFLAVLGVFACRTTTPATQTPVGKTEPKPVKFLVKKIETRLMPFDWFGAKTHADITLPDDQTVGFGLNIRVRRDSVIWLQFMKVGFEGARARITPENGVEILNRQDKTYMVMSFAMMEKLYGVALTFGELQDLLMGLPAGYAKRRFKSSVADNFHLLSSSDGGETMQVSLEDSTYFMRRYQRENAAGKLDFSLDAYEKLGEKYFSKLRNVSVKGSNGQRLELRIDFNEVTFDEPQKIGFEIPDKYRRL